MKSTVIIVFWIVSLASAWAQQPCRTQVFDKLIHSLQVHVADQLMSIPCIEAGSDQQIEISFDALSPQAVRYAYSIVHCHADWTPSTLSQIEYLDGFQGIPIDDFANSMTTTVEYVNYQFRLPNEEVRFKVSGNYADLYRLIFLRSYFGYSVFHAIIPLYSFRQSCNGSVYVLYNNNAYLSRLFAIFIK